MHHGIGGSRAMSQSYFLCTREFLPFDITSNTFTKTAVQCPKDLFLIVKYISNMQTVDHCVIELN